MKFTLEEFCSAIGGQPLQGDLTRSFQGASLDTRQLRLGNIFFAMKGERTDGHRFLGDAKRRRAAAAVVERRPAGRTDLKGFPLFRVASSVRALQRGAAWYRRRFHLPVIAITGSNGKTTVKDLTAWVLRGALGEKVLASRGSFNNHLGVPLTLFELRRGIRAAVVEMAMNAKGEIRRLARLAAPGTGVVLNAGAAHLKGFTSLAEVARAKAELLEELPAGGWAILNADDERVWSRRRATAARVLGFGAWRGEVRAERITLNRRGLAGFHLRTPGGSAWVQLRLPGAHSAVNAAAAAAIGWTFGMSPPAIARRLQTFTFPPRMRLEHRRLPNGALAIVDCYNANPGSCQAALSYLHDMRVQHLVLVLGEMREMGSFSLSAHRHVGTLAARLNPKLLIGIGSGARATVEAARKAGVPTLWTPRPEGALKALTPALSRNTVALFKASRKIRLERLVDRLTHAL